MKRGSGPREMTGVGDLDEARELFQIHVYSVSLSTQAKQYIGRMSRPNLAWNT
ncbi:hypothetical protein GCM10009689_29430 [Brevibacterium antiquum]